MKTRAIVSLSLSALLLGGTTVGCAMSGGGGLASAGTRASGSAAGWSAKADKALAKGRADLAIGYAERAVALTPNDAGARTLLGRSYLKAGRFASAAQAFADVLRLTPGDGKAALDLALARIGTGDWTGARRTLSEHEATIAPADRGLALALAGDPQGGVALLMAAARTPEATVTTRQNLALTLALAGNWEEARVVAAADLSPADVDKRMTEWAAFAQPSSASDQLAALLGVTAVADAGQPVGLALAAPASRPVEAAAVAAPVQVATAPVLAPAPTETVASPADSADATPPSVPAILPAAGPMRVALKPAPAASHAPAGGHWYVQLGAYRSQAVARDSWTKIVRRDAGLRGRTPFGMNFQAKGASFYRVSIGGLARTDADRLCRAYKGRGGDCFVRAGAGDQVATWVKSGVQLASR